jgi:glutamate/tyrosine decarboxylase-like PLP-dependent enzyme
VASRDDLPDLAARLLERVLRDEAERPALSAVSPEEMAARLELDLAGPARTLAEVTEELVTLAGLTPRTTTTSFFNQLFAGRDEAAVLGEILAAVQNVSMYTYKAAGPHILLEQALLDHLAGKVGLTGADGSFQAGGSLSNLVAFLVARDEAFPSWREEGPPLERPALYASAECHYSVPKAATVLGLGRSSLRRIPVDGRGRLDVDRLARRLAEDRTAGDHPFLVVATAGTTVRGAFDPLREIAVLCREEGLWLHLDGAFGASVALSPRRRALLDGVEQVDSLTWDLHKMMGVPLPCSILLVRRPGLLQKALEETASYLFQADEDRVNPGLRNIHCGRRNDALKLWAAWRHHGDAGMAERVERLFALTGHAVRRIQAHSRLHLVEPPACINVCFEAEGADSAAICELLDREGTAKMGWGWVRGRAALRLVCANPSTDEADLDRLLEAVVEAAGRLAPPG